MGAFSFSSHPKVYEPKRREAPRFDKTRQRFGRTKCAPKGRGSAQADPSQSFRAECQALSSCLSRPEADENLPVRQTRWSEFGRTNVVSAPRRGDERSEESILPGMAYRRVLSSKRTPRFNKLASEFGHPKRAPSVLNYLLPYGDTRRSRSIPNWRKRWSISTKTQFSIN